MQISTAYLPQDIFAPSGRGNLPPPRVFISPQRYIQGRGVLRGVGRYLSLMRAKRVALLMSERGHRTEGVQLLEGLRSTGGEVCAQTLYKDGRAAAAAVAANTVNDSLEAVVEANTLLSGLGFESGGLAAAHGVAQSFTAIPNVHANYLHGEMVAMGTLTQLMMESRPDEAARVAEFFANVGLPIHLGQLSLDAGDKSALAVVSEGTLAFPFIGNMPTPVTAELVRSAILDAHSLGLSVAEKNGDAAYRGLHNC